jgi:hypothetical protein
MAGIARRVDVAAGIGPLATSDYASAFEADVPHAGLHAPEEWARAMFEGAPPAMRWLVRLGWKYVLLLQLGPRRAPTYVAGWSITAATPEAVTLEVHSALVAAHKVLRVDDGRVVVATFVRYRSRLGRWLWSAITPIHHRTEPWLLGHAVKHPP